MKRRIENGILILLMAVFITACGSANQIPDEKTIKCTISIECTNIFNHMDKLKKEKLDIIPEDGMILKETQTEVQEGTNVYEALSLICREKDILMESSFTPGTGSAYVEGIANLYEFDCGELSGWQYSVNGEYKSVGCSECLINEGDVIEWRYTCDLGRDLRE